MKDGSRYSVRLKKRFARLPSGQSAGGDPAKPSDPLRQLAAAVLGRGLGEEAGFRALELIFDQMVDWNEVRVSSPSEIAAQTKRTLPEAYKRCDRLRGMLNDVFDRECVMSLDRVKGMKLRDAREFLASLRAVDGFAVSSVVVWSLGGHAIPMDDTLLEGLRKEDLVHPTATREQVQAFLERAIHADQAKSFCLAMRQLVSERKQTTARSAKKTTATKQRSGPGANAKRTKKTIAKKNEGATRKKAVAKKKSGARKKAKV